MRLVPPTMFGRLTRFPTSSRRSRFSWTRAAFSASTISWSLTACPTIEATVLSSRMSSSKSTSRAKSLSTVSTPMVFPRTPTGTPMKEMFSFARPLREPVRLRKSGSLPMSGTTNGAPEANTRPVIPSPTL